MTDICATKWNIDGSLKKKFENRFNKPNFLTWYFLHKVNCVYNNKLKIDLIRKDYFIGLNSKEKKEYKKKYKDFKKKGIHFTPNKNVSKEFKNQNWVYIYKDIEFFNKYIKIVNYIKDYKIENKLFLKNKDILNCIKPLYFNNIKSKNEFISLFVKFIISKLSYKNIKIRLKFDYYEQNYINKFNNLNNYKELYSKLKNNGVENEFNIVFKKLYKIINGIINNLEI